jgi:hypothetical protein
MGIVRSSRTKGDGRSQDAHIFKIDSEFHNVFRFRWGPRRTSSTYDPTISPQIVVRELRSGPSLHQFLIGDKAERPKGHLE